MSAGGSDSQPIVQTVAGALIDVQRVSGGYTEHLNPFEVVIDKSVVGRLGPGDSLAFDVAPGRHELCIKYYWTGSEKVDLYLGPAEVVCFRCETRANLLTDGYWATIGRRRYLKLTQVRSRGGEASTTTTEQKRVDVRAVTDRRRSQQAAQSKPSIDALHRWPAMGLVLMVAAGLLSLALTRGLEFLATISIIFIAVEVVIAIYFHLLAPRSPSPAAVGSHRPFRLRPIQQTTVSAAFAVAGIAALTGLLNASDLAGWLAVGAAVVGGANVVATHRRPRS
jgi:hypothetical protein